MSNVSRLTEWFESQIGTTENPVNDVYYNTIYYGRRVNGSEYPWCCVFCWCGFRETGLGELFFDGKKTASCTELMNWAKGRDRLVFSDYREGDLLFFNWGGDRSVAQHVGYCLGKNTGGKYETIEGNTSLGGSQTNGGMVLKRAREERLIIGAFRPDYGEDDEMTYEKFKEYMDRYVKEMNLQPVSEWARESWNEAVSRSVFDGTMPKGALTREQAAVVFARLGLLK